MSEQSKASLHRWDDARALLSVGRYRGAMYLAGYSVECLLKARLMRKFGCRHLGELGEKLRDRGFLDDYDSIYTHQLSRLLSWAGGSDTLRGDLKLWSRFNIVNEWIPAWRYNPDQSSLEEAATFLEAIEQIVEWINHNL